MESQRREKTKSEKSSCGLVKEDFFQEFIVLRASASGAFEVADASSLSDRAFIRRRQGLL